MFNNKKKRKRKMALKLIITKMALLSLLLSNTWQSNMNTQTTIL